MVPGAPGGLGALAVLAVLEGPGVLEGPAGQCGWVDQTVLGAAVRTA